MDFTHPFEFTLIGKNSKGDMEVMESARGNAKGVAAAMREAAELIDPDPAKAAGERMAQQMLEGKGFNLGSMIGDMLLGKNDPPAGGHG